MTDESSPGQASLATTSQPSQPAAMALPTTFSSLAIRPYRYLWLANIGFFASFQMAQVTLGWLVYDLTGDPVRLGGISAALGAAMLACSPLGGVLADRVTKRDLLMITQVFLATIALALALLSITGLIQYWHLLLAAVGFGLAMSFNMPARQALLAEIVGERQLVNAIALNASGMNLMRIGSPAIAGALLAAVGSGGVFLVMFGLYLYVLAMTFRIPRITPTVRKVQASVFGDLSEGVVYLFRSPVLLALIGAELVFVLVGMPYHHLMPIFASDVFGIGPDGLGTMLSAVGIGALVGSLGVASLSRLPYRGLMLLGSGILFGASLFAFANAPSYAIALPLLTLAGIGSSSYMALNNGLVMGHVTQAMRGRIMSIHMFTFGMQPLGTMPLSALAGAYGGPTAVGLAGAVVAVGMSLIALFRPIIRGLR